MRLIDEQSKMQLKALLSFGYVNWLDFLFALALTANSVTCWFHAMFRGFDPMIFLCYAASHLVVISMWILFAVFRCTLHVLRARAELKMLPADAAKLALQFAASGPGK